MYGDSIGGSGRFPGRLSIHILRLSQICCFVCVCLVVVLFVSRCCFLFVVSLLLFVENKYPLNLKGYVLLGLVGVW